MISELEFDYSYLYSKGLKPFFWFKSRVLYNILLNFDVFNWKIKITFLLNFFQQNDLEKFLDCASDEDYLLLKVNNYTYYCYLF